MSRFTDFLENVMANPSYSSDNANVGNVAGLRKYPTLKRVPDAEEEMEYDVVDRFIEKNNFNMDRRDVESIVAIVSKTLEDWNREMNYDFQEIKKVVVKALEDKLIDLR